MSETPTGRPPKTPRKILVLRVFAGFALVVLAGLILVRVVYGGGTPYPDVSTAPLVSSEEVEVLVELDMPPGNVSVSPGSGRIFFNTHPFAGPARFGEASLFELVDGEPRPYPSAEEQARLQGPFGMTVDAQERLWMVETAGLDHDSTRLLAIDLATDRVVITHVFEPGVARFAQDLRVSVDGRHVVLADTGAFRLTEPSIYVFDVQTREVVRRFSNHDSLRPQDWLMRTTRGEPYKVGWGLLSFVVGVDGIALGERPEREGDAWLYYATMTHDSLYRVPLSTLLDLGLDDAGVAAQVERVGPKPMSDGIALGPAGEVLVTDVENGGIARLGPKGELVTLVADPRVIWADGVTTTAAGEVLFTDSAIPAYIRQDLRPPARDVLDAAGPYAIYRFTLPGI